MDGVEVYISCGGTDDGGIDENYTNLQGWVMDHQAAAWKMVKDRWLEGQVLEGESAYCLE